MTDSGYTPDELHRILDEIFAAATPASEAPDARHTVAIEMGIHEGDAIVTSDAGTVMLTTPRALIDARIATVMAAFTRRVQLDEAIAWVLAVHPHL